MAPLEMVLCIPILFFVFALIIYTGFFMIGQAQVTSLARHDAWRKRHTEADSKAYDFQGAVGRVEAIADRDITLSPLFVNFPDPRSRHVVLGDAWSGRAAGPSPRDRERHQELNDHWNSSLTAELTILGGKNTAGQAAADVNSLTSLGSRLEAMINSYIGDSLAETTDVMNRLNSKRDEAEQKSQQKQEQGKNLLIDDIERLDGEITALEMEIAAKEKRVEDLDNELKNNDKLSEEEKQELEKERNTLRDDDLPRLRREKSDKEEERKLKSDLLSKFPK